MISWTVSASGTGLPIRPDPGAPAGDSDIFVLNVDDALASVAGRVNLTNSPEAIDDDADWSPDGQMIVFTSRILTAPARCARQRRPSPPDHACHGVR